MAGLKRKQNSSESTQHAADGSKAKKMKSSRNEGSRSSEKTRSSKKDKSKSKDKPKERDDDDFGFDDESDGGVPLNAADDDREQEQQIPKKKKGDKYKAQKALREQKRQLKQEGGNLASFQKDNPTPGMATSSKEAHAKQKALAKERKAAKPNADSIAQAKKLWERLRLKSHVKLEERKTLVGELFSIITGNVKDFVFKHDSVRVVQCALKYANMGQRKMIARELKGEYRALAESRYAKFLIAKLLVEGDDEVKKIVISEFYGHVRRLINHPEAAWILDDAYRGVATPQQKAIMLREWYGPEFALFKEEKSDISGDLATILEQTPEKRKPILNDLFSLINQLIQKKMTGFTMLHDAMLQYFLNIKPESEEWTEFFALLKDDEEGDLLKNLAFTKSGSRVVCIALAHSDAKSRRQLLKVYKDTMEMLAFDPNGHHILLAAYDVIDDTKMTGKAIFPELLGPDANQEAQQEKIVALANHLVGRISLLYLLAGPAKWLLTDEHTAILSEVHAIRNTTSKKDPDTRREELITYFSEPILAAITNRAADFASSSFGCYFVVETLLGTTSDNKGPALAAIAAIAAGDPTDEQHLAHSAPAGRMLKRLVEGGRYDPSTKQVTLISPPLGFSDILYATIKDELVSWATGPSSFVVVSLLESSEFTDKDTVRKTLSKNEALLQAAADGEADGTADQGGVSVGLEGKKGKDKKKGKKEKGKKEKKGKKNKGNAGAKMLLEKLN